MAHRITLASVRTVLGAHGGGRLATWVPVTALLE